MNCAMHNSAAARSRRVAGLAGIAALALIALAPAAVAADLDDTALRGSFSDYFTSKGYSRWDGVYFGAQFGVTNMNTDFGNSTSSLVAYILRNTTLEEEAQPSSWTTLPSNTTNGRQFGGFIGYNIQWSELVIGAELAYNRMSSMESSAADSISRLVTTSDAVQHAVTIDASSRLKLIDYATLRARAGYSIGQFLPYAVLGAAVGRFNYSTTATVTDVRTVGGVVQPPFTQTESNSKDNAIVGGFLVGLGMDVAVLPNVFLRGEWEMVAFTPVNGNRANINTARVGLGMKF